MNVVIMTCPPRTTDALKASLAGADVVEAVDSYREGTLINLVTALSLGCAVDEPFTVLQDDIVVCHNFVPYVSRMLPVIETEGWMVNWFDTEFRWQPIDRPSMIWRDAETFAYSQAITYSSKMAKKILDFLVNEAIPQSQKDDRGQIHGDDTWTRAALIEQREIFLKHLPSLVQHIGEESLLAPGMTLEHHSRVSRNFIGTEFDVMNWPRIL